MNDYNFIKTGPFEVDKKSKTARKLLSYIQQDPDITDPSNITVVVEEEGFFFKKKIVDLIGKSSNEREKQRAEEIVKINTPKNTMINNKIQVK